MPRGGKRENSGRQKVPNGKRVTTVVPEWKIIDFKKRAAVIVDGYLSESEIINQLQKESLTKSANENGTA